MNKLSVLISLLLTGISFSQSFDGPAGTEGSLAIQKTDERIISWATGIELTRGYLNIEQQDYEVNGSNKVSFGVAENALGVAEGNASDVVSLGDSGVAIITFENPIFDAEGADFAIFENSFSDQFLELAFVEVSTDGVTYVRFPSTSETQTVTQISGFGNLQAQRLNNLAGKYKGGWGTPFDLNELSDNPNIDINNINYVKIIDVVGSIGNGATYDAQGNKVNDPFPTPYESGGFDLDAVGVINTTLGLKKESINPFAIYPNPSNGLFTIKGELINSKITITDLSGRVVLLNNQVISNELVYTLTPGSYFVNVLTKGKRFISKIIIK